jgi:HK97 family phage major capsid protein
MTTNVEQMTAALQDLRGAATMVQATRTEVAALKRAVDDRLTEFEGRLELKASRSDVLALSRGVPLQAEGGFLVPQEIIGPLQMRARDANPFRGLVRTVAVATRDLVLPLSNADAATGWVGENATRTATTVPTLTGAKPTFGTLYALVAASEELVTDAQFDIGQWFAMVAGAAMGAAEMTAIISGNGTNRPSGLFRVPPETGADGARTAGALRALEVTGLNDATLADKLIDLVYDLKADYRQRGT